MRRKKPLALSTNRRSAKPGEPEERSLHDFIISKRIINTGKDENNI
jgi:hypothetical protein